MSEPEQQFQCPGCYQRYTLPPATVRLIIKHMKDRHEESHDHKWVKRRLKEIAA